MDSHALSRLDALPPMPHLAQDVLRVLNDDAANLAEIAVSLSREPGLTARIVAAANAAFFAGQRPVYSVDDAAVRLGLNRVRVLATTALLGSHFNARACGFFDPRRYWFDAMKAAFCASRMADCVPLETASSAAYLCGLLHNIGLLMMAFTYPAEMSDVFEAAKADSGRSLSGLERERLGFDHHQAGGELLKRWRLPREVSAAVSGCSEEDYAGDFPRLVRLTGICAQWAQDGFQDIPRDPSLRAVDERRLTWIGQSCQREEEQLQSFAYMLCSAA